MIRMDDSVMNSLAIAKCHKNTNKEINSLSFSFDGEKLVAASNDDSLSFYSCKTGELISTINCKKQGCSNVCFTHHSDCVIVGSKKSERTGNSEHAIRYLSAYDNKQLREFIGHDKSVTNIQMCPGDDHFISCGQDKRVLLWDLRTAIAKGKIENLSSPACTGFDPQGTIFAIAQHEQNKTLLKIYDLAKYEKGPIYSWNQETSPPTSLTFSPDGSKIMLTTSRSNPSGQNLIIDSYDGKKLYTIEGFYNENNKYIQSCFSPDGDYILSGSEDGIIHIYRSNKGENIIQMRAHPKSCYCIQFHPKSCLMASACKNVLLWLPDTQKLTKMVNI